MRTRWPAWQAGQLADHEIDDILGVAVSELRATVSELPAKLC